MSSTDKKIKIHPIAPGDSWNALPETLDPQDSPEVVARPASHLDSAYDEITS